MNTALCLPETQQEQQLFNFEGQQVRIKLINGEPWFVAADLCKVLEILNTTQVIRNLDADEYTLCSIEGMRNKRPVNAVNESGLYSLILQSRKPQAKQFKKWITSEVLPSIRKHGGYINPNDVRDPIEIADSLLKIAKEQRAVIQQQEAKIIAMKPCVDIVENFFTASVDEVSFNTLAKLSNFTHPVTGRVIGGKTLKDICITLGYIDKTDRLPRQEYRKNKFFNTYYATRYINGAWTKVPVTRITPTGQVAIYKKVQQYLRNFG